MGDSSAASLLMAGIRGALDPSTAAFRTDSRGGRWLLFFQPSVHGGWGSLLTETPARHPHGGSSGSFQTFPGHSL